MSTNMSAGWAEFFGSFRDDLTKDMEYSRMQAHQTFMSELNRQDASSGYVTEDGKPLTNFEYNKIPEEQRGNLTSAAKYAFNNQKSLLDEQSRRRREDASFAEGEKRKHRDSDLAFEVRKAEATEGAKIRIQNKELAQRIEANQQRYTQFQQSDVYQGLDDRNKQIVDTMGSMGVDFQKVGGNLLKAMTASKKAEKIDPSVLSTVADILKTNDTYMRAVQTNPTASMYMLQESASIVQGLPDRSAQNFMETVGRSLSIVAQTPPDKRKELFKNMEEQNPQLHETITGILNVGLNEGEKEIVKKESESWFKKISNIFSSEGKPQSFAQDMVGSPDTAGVKDVNKAKREAAIQARRKQQKGGFPFEGYKSILD